MRTPRACAALAAVTVTVAVALALSACGGTGRAQSIVGKKSLVIGVKEDQPGLGLKKADGAYEGFDVDVAKYVARKLGADVTFRTAISANRESFLQRGTVDLVVATYSITAARKTEVTFGGPYYVAHQDTLVRADDQSIGNVRELKGKRLCRVEGSVSWKRVVEERKVDADLVPASTYSECLAKLTGGELDAVSTDDLILAGFASEEGDKVKIVNAPISDEKYGIGIREGDVDGCEAVNKAITEMYQDGTAATLLRKWFGDTSLRLVTTVPQFEGCDEPDA